MSDRIQITYGSQRPRINSPAGRGAQYLHRKRELGGTIENAVGLAVGVLYAPLEVALNGGTPQEVEDEIVRSELVFTEYKALARQLTSNHTPQEDIEIIQDNTTIELGESF